MQCGVSNKRGEERKEDPASEAWRWEVFKGVCKIGGEKDAIAFSLFDLLARVLFCVIAAPSSHGLSSLPPGGTQPDKRADETSKTDGTVVEVGPAESGSGVDDITEIRDELCGNCSTLTVDTVSHRQVTSFNNSEKEGGTTTYRSIFFASTTPSPSLRSIALSLCFNVKRL